MKQYKTGYVSVACFNYTKTQSLKQYKKEELPVEYHWSASISTQTQPVKQYRKGALSVGTLQLVQNHSQ